MFAELLTSSNYSFLRGASHPEELVERAHRLGLLALGLCDRDGLYGAVRCYKKAREIGQRVLVGVELSLDLTESANQASSRPHHHHDQHRRHFDHVPSIIFYPENTQGYQHLCRIVTIAHAHHPKGCAGYPIFTANFATLSGLIVIIPTDSLLLLSRPPFPNDLATRLLTRLHELGSGSTYLATFRHHDGEDLERERVLHSAHRAHAFPILASARPRFHTRRRRFLADVLDCIRRGTTLDQAGTWLAKNAEARLLSEPEIRARFSDHPEWVERTREVVERCSFTLGQLHYKFPCQLPPGRSPDTHLAELVARGKKERYPNGVPEQVERQLCHELEVIAGLQMASYFLSAWEIVQLARRRNILCQGRGSAANSAVCFVLGVTAVDPARSNLLFERFMSPERREPPDIDIDFEHERREEIIADIYQQYGHDRAAMVAEVVRYRPRSALREVAKVFGLSSEQIERLSQLVTMNHLSHHSDENKTPFLAQHLHSVGLDVDDSRLRRVLHLAAEIEGFPRHLSIHVGGFVLSTEPIETVCPVEPARMHSRTVVPWDKDDIDTLGFFKVDILSLGILTAIRKALSLIHNDDAQLSSARPFCPIAALARIPAEDPVVYQRIAAADTIGVFQIESRAQAAMLPRLRPKCFYDLVIQVAIVRPGPITGGMVHPYLARRQGQAKVLYPHPGLRVILERTLGVPIFQEQVMQIAVVGAGYTGGEADQLRRDMAAWHKNSRLLSHRQRLLEGFHQRGIETRFGEALFEQIKGFGEYGFPESHAASFALLVYASAWLKTHFRAHFLVALLNSQPMGFYSPHSLIRDAVRHGVVVRDVDISHSDWDTTLEGSCGSRVVRLGLGLLRGVDRRFVGRLLLERQRSPFTSIEDFRLRLCPKRSELDLLAAAGAFSSLKISRRNALWEGRRPLTLPLFSRSNTCQEANSGLFLTITPGEELCLDYSTKGLCLSHHPLSLLRSRLEVYGVLTAQQLTQHANKSRVRVAGMVLCRQKPLTAKGILFVMLEDETGTINLVVRPELCRRSPRLLTEAPFLLVEGTLDRSFCHEPDAVSVIHVQAENVWALRPPAELPAADPRSFH